MRGIKLRRKETHKPRVIFSVTNCICHDQRVLKMAQTVSHLGTDVWIVGRRKGKCCDKDNVAFKTVRFRMLFKRGFLFYKFFNIRLFFFLLFRKANLLVSNDLDTLFPNYLVSRLKRIPLVYDSHEYFTGVPEIQDRPIVKFVWTEIEKMIFPKLKNIMTVSDPIADRYEGEYGIRPLVVRNYSRNSDDIIPYGKEALGIDPDHFLLIYQGTGINRDRGGEELIEAIAATSNVSLLVVGSGDLLNTLKEKVMTTGISNRVHFIDSVPWEELMRYTKSADAGVSLDKNDNINYRYSLPNKLFDYISAGIPVIAGDLPEVTKIVTGYNCGLVIPEISPGKIKEAINRLSEEKKLIDDMRRNASKASSSLNWENEALKVSDFYRRVLNKRQ
jgi:glycosyltransferase involved in cell wall biosynthesis